MPSNRANPSLGVFRGKTVQASYQDTRIPDHQGNPLLEALPPIYLTDAAVIDALGFWPKYQQDQRNWPDHLRAHLTQTVNRLFHPFPIHLDLRQRLDLVLRDGYVCRNPITSGFWQDIERHVASLTGDDPEPPQVWSQATGFVIIGISGGGKSFSVRRVLSLYPQVIIHHRYQERDCSFVQLVWLMLECPNDGSTKQLCINFLQAVDTVLGTTYSSNYMLRYAEQNKLIAEMARVASLQGLGVLVVDEIQRLSVAKSGGIQKMLEFFTELVNKIGIPVILIGTYKTYSLLMEEFRLARRGAGQGDMRWEPLKEDENWNMFLQSLWHYRYVKKESPLTPEVSHTLYELTCGIPDLAVKMFRLAQMRAMARGIEAVTPTVLRSISRDSFHVVAPMLDALRRRDIGFLMKVDDLLSIDDRLVLEEMHQKLRGFQPSLRGGVLLSPAGASNGDPNPKSASSKLPEVPENVAPTEAPIKDGATPSQEGLTVPPENQPTEAKGQKEQLEAGIWAALLQARKKKISAHKAIVEAGYTGHYHELPGVVQKVTS
jgi:hypothetical protein